MDRRKERKLVRKESLASGEEPSRVQGRKNFIEGTEPLES